MKSVTKIELGKTYIVKDIEVGHVIGGALFTRAMRSTCGKEIVFEKLDQADRSGYYEGYWYAPEMLLDPDVDEKRNLALEGLGQRIKDLQEAYAGLVKDWQEAYAKLVTQRDEPEFEYPLIMKSKFNGEVARFDGLQDRTTIWTGEGICEIGYHTVNSVPHADPGTWRPVPYDKERNLWHGQPVEVYDNDDTHRRVRLFYDAISKTTFNYNGEIYASDWYNIEAIPPEEYKQWMYEAYKTLEGINDPS